MVASNVTGVSPMMPLGLFLWRMGDPSLLFQERLRVVMVEGAGFAYYPEWGIRVSRSARPDRHRTIECRHEPTKPFGSYLVGRRPPARRLQEI